MDNVPNSLNTSRRWANWGGLPRILLIMALLLPALSVASKADAAPKVQPGLLAMAAQHPNTTVGVIVQKVVKDKSVENMVTRLGGIVTRDLRIINAFAAQLPAKVVTQLASDKGVRWVS